MTQQFQKFDKITGILKDNGLYDTTSLQQKIKFEQSYNYDQWNTSQTHTLIGTGDIEKQDIYEKVNQEILKDVSDFSFSFKVKVGNKLPTYKKLYKVEDGQETSLAHKEGEVLLIDVWATWCGPCQKPMDHNQKMIESNEAWKDKARIVAVSVDDDIQRVRERIEKKKWNSLEHLSLLSWNHDHNLIKDFNISGIPFVALINKTGVIDFIGHPSEINLQQRINQLINGSQTILNTQSNQQEQQQVKNINLALTTPQIGDILIKNLETLKQSSLNLPGFYLQLNKTKSLNQGKQQTIYGRLIIKFQGKAEQTATRRQILDILYKNVPENAIQNKSFINDIKVQTQEQRDFFTKLANKYNLLAPYQQEQYILYPLLNNQWQINKSLAFAPVNIGKDGSKQNVVEIRNQINEYVRNLEQDRDTTCIDKIVKDKVPVVLVGNPFFGIDNVQNSKTKQIGNFTAQKDIIQILAFYWSAQASQNFINQLIKTVKNIKQNIHINVICKKQTFVELQKSQAENPDLITIYQGNSVKQTQVFNISSIEYLLVINKQGNVIHARKVDLNNLSQIINKANVQTKAQSQKVNVEYINELNSIVKSDDFNKLIKKIKQLDYSPSIQIKYNKNVDANTYDKPIVKLNYRVTDQKLFQSVIAALKKVTTINSTSIQVFEIPSGKTCESCKCELNLPYYFYHFTNVFRCVSCAEKQNEDNPKPLNRYQINENGILVFKQNSSFDKVRIGNNVQPQTDEQCQAPGFMCNGCSQSNQKNARYICLGCRRQPNPRHDYVDFCWNCAKTLAGNDQNKKKSVLGQSQDEGHKEWHPLLRINYSPRGYYNY